MPYNPFDTPIGNVLKPSDLQDLVKLTVAEGYYVEYKSELQKNERIGRSIASFANTYGGWYIIGVKTDAHNVAIEVRGFSLLSCHDPISKVRDVVKSHIDPTPIFYPQVVSLGEDKAVLVVYVPDGQDTPFISKDGRIYRRVSDSSDPILETNRYTVDKLYENGREIRRHFEELCCDKRSFSQAQDGQGWVSLFLSPYPLGIVEKPNLWSNKGIQELLELSQRPLKIFNESGEVTGNLPFNSAQPTFQSVILRQTQLEHLAFNSLEIELFNDGQAKLFIPLQYLSSLEDWNLDSNFFTNQTSLELNFKSRQGSK